MKVVFFVQGLHVAASRYRVLQYIPYLEKGGFPAEILEFPKNSGEWASAYGTLKKADVVFVQRKRIPLIVLLRLRSLGKKIVYDFDDAVMFKNSLSENPYSLRRRMSFRRMLRFTDLVIAGNRFLAGEAAKYHNNIRILPTPVDAGRYSGKEYAEGEGVNIGWIGDHGSIHYMRSYRDVWEELGRKYPQALLTIICDTFIETEQIPLRKVQWRYDSEIEDLKALDVGVMPLFEDRWSQGKCGFKIIQYLGVGVPAVCTPVGINRDVVEDGVNGFWARSREDWMERLSILIEDAGLRQRMGMAGRKKIMEHYTVQACAPLLMQWLGELR